MTQNPNNIQDQNDTTPDANQDNTSTLSTSNTQITQQFQTQQTSPRIYDPPPLHPQYSIQTSSHNSPHQGSSNTQTTNTVQFQTTIPTTQPLVQTLAYTPAQNTKHSKYSKYKILKHKTYKLLYLIILFTHRQYLTTLPLEIFLDHHYKLFQLTHFHSFLQVEILNIHNILQPIIPNSTLYNPFIHPTHQILQRTSYKARTFRHLIILLQLLELILT